MLRCLATGEPVGGPHPIGGQPSVPTSWNVPPTRSAPGLIAPHCGRRERKKAWLQKPSPKTLLSQQAEQKPAAGRASSPRCRAKAAAVLFAARASSREEQRAVHEEQPTGWIRQARARLLRAQRRFRRDVLRSHGGKRHDKQLEARARARASLVWLLCSIPSRCYMC